MSFFRTLFVALLIGFGTLCVGAETGVVSKNEALNRLKALPPPVQSASGAIFVRCASPDRANLRWPVMRFAETVRTHLSEAFLPLGSTLSPLSIELGTQTNSVTGIERRVFRTGDGFSQLILRVPNPETVDLEVLREGIAEALLRERVREETGRYAAFAWPNWWLTAVVNASKGNLWKVEAYERVAAQLEATGIPTVEQVLVTREKTSPEMDAFFVMWLLEETAYAQKDNRLALLTTLWDSEALCQTLSETSWQAWLKAQADRIFMPGTLTRSQFKRWRASLETPQDAEAAVAMANGLGRVMLARPQPFRDLCELYLKAYTAYISEGIDDYKTLRALADEAAEILQNYFNHHELLTDEIAVPTLSTSETPSAH